MLEKFNHILLKFDQDMAKKIDKSNLIHIQKDMDEKFVQANRLTEMDKRLVTINEFNYKRYEELNGILKNLHKDILKKVEI